MAEGPGAGPRLAELLDTGRRLWEELESGTEPSSGAPAVQDKVRQGLQALRQAEAMVAQLDLFSENEELEEIASADLKFLPLPALLGALTLKQVDLSKRLEHLESARTHFWRFLKLCSSYGLGSFQLPPTSPPGEEDTGSPAPGGSAAAQPSLVAMASSRQAKIERTFTRCLPSGSSLHKEICPRREELYEHLDFHPLMSTAQQQLCAEQLKGDWGGRYKQKKELENRLASMRSFVEGGQADEDQIREFYTLQIRKWINTSLEEIESIDQEMVILRSRGTAKQPSAPPHGTSRQARTPLKPFILTRDAAQAKSLLGELCQHRAFSCGLEKRFKVFGLEQSPPPSITSRMNSLNAVMGRVFGAGYPGLPTMTVDDWYEQRRRQGVVSAQSAPRRAPGITDEELQKQQQEKKEEEDDEEALQKARNWDDWKDMHPRGYGNRQNVG